MTSNGSHDWKNWLIGIMVPLNIALVGYIWTGSQNNTIRIEGDFRGMIRDVAEIKTEMREVNRRLEVLEGGPHKFNTSLAPDNSKQSFPFPGFSDVAVLK